MRCLVLEHHHEWLVTIASVLQPIEHLVGDDVGGVTGMRLGDRLTVVAGGDHRRVVVRPLSLEHVVVVVTLRRGDQMPLTDHCCLVTGRLQQLWKGLLVAVEAVAVGFEAIEMASNTYGMLR